MAADDIVRSFGDVSVREDVVLNAVEILTATEDQVFNIIGRSVAINTTHIYLTDTLLTAASQAVEEAADDGRVAGDHGDDARDDDET